MAAHHIGDHSPLHVPPDRCPGYRCPEPRRHLTGTAISSARNAASADTHRTTPTKTTATSAIINDVVIRDFGQVSQTCSTMDTQPHRGHEQEGSV
ncbi:Uncharacterised protein [Mycobacteroides abscessus subsp. abscessus]|nr:Uncharacterised protein [Mycobacteroides abscessus subsp. abscessus]